MASVLENIAAMLSPRQAEAKVVPGDAGSLKWIADLAALTPGKNDPPEIAESKRRQAAIFKLAMQVPEVVRVFTPSTVDPDDPATQGMYTARTGELSVEGQGALTKPYLLAHELMHFLHKRNQIPAMHLPGFDSEELVKTFLGNYEGDNPNLKTFKITPYVSPATIKALPDLIKFYKTIYPGYK